MSGETVQYERGSPPELQKEKHAAEDVQPWGVAPHKKWCKEDRRRARAQHEVKVRRRRRRKRKAARRDTRASSAERRCGERKRERTKRPGAMRAPLRPRFQRDLRLNLSTFRARGPYKRRQKWRAFPRPPRCRRADKCTPAAPFFFPGISLRFNVAKRADDDLSPHSPAQAPRTRV